MRRGVYTPASERAMKRVLKSATGCWIYAGNLFSNGYGAVSVPTTGTRRSKRLAHRIVYEALVGPIPPGMTLDHLCEVKNCVNPAHLKVATHRENILRSNGVSAINARKTYCNRGHSLDDAYRDKLGRRRCRPCHLEWTRRHAAAKRARS